MTWPLATRAGQAIPGDSFDGWQNYWNLWWVKKALLETFQNPFHTDYLFYPTGVDLYFHTLNIFNGLISLPVQGVGNLFWAYNFVVLLAFVLGGYGTFLLIRYVTTRQGLAAGPGREWAAFAGGCVFTFSPFHFAHLLGHMQVFALEWIPFYVLTFLQAMDSLQRERKPGAQRGWKSLLKRSCLPALFLILVGLCDWYYVMYLGIFSLLYLAYLATRRQLRWEHLVILGASTLLFGVILSPLLAPMMRIASQKTYMVPDPEQTRALSADLLAFVTPSEFHPLWGEAVRGLAERFTSTRSERTVLAGIIPLGLALIGAIRWFKKTWFWWLSLAVFLVLALGPVLHVGGVTRFGPAGIEIPLPYLVLHRVVPFMRISRSVSRFDVMIMLSLGVLVGLGVLALARPAQKKTSRSPAVRATIVGLVATALICFEFLPVPYPISPPDTPGWYEALAEEPGDFAILNLPMNWDRPGYLLYQTVHGKRLTVAYISRDDPSTLVERLGILQQFRHLGRDVILQDAALVAGTTFRHLNVRYLVADLYKMPGGEERDYTLALLREIVGADAQPVYQDDRLIVYTAPLQRAPATTLILGRGWGERKSRGSQTWRPVDHQAGLQVLAERTEGVQIRLEAFASPPCTLELVGTEGVLGRWDLDEQPRQLLCTAFDAEPGLTNLQIQTSGPGTCYVGALDILP